MFDEQKTKNDLWTEDEWAISLAHYCFNKGTCTQKSSASNFANKLNSYTGKNRSMDSIILRFCNYKSVDPEFSGIGMANKSATLKSFWDKYITNDNSLTLLAKKYSTFLNESPKGISSSNASTIGKNPKTFVSSVVSFYRSPVVREATLARAKGVCEMCGKPAPFRTFENIPFLEVHHIIPLADEGVDELNNTAALCPNCHRKAHYSNLTNAEKSKLKMVAK